MQRLIAKHLSGLKLDCMTIPHPWLLIFSTLNILPCLRSPPKNWVAILWLFKTPSPKAQWHIWTYWKQSKWCHTAVLQRRLKMDRRRIRRFFGFLKWTKDEYEESSLIQKFFEDLRRLQILRISSKIRRFSKENEKFRC